MPDTRYDAVAGTMPNGKTKRKIYGTGPQAYAVAGLIIILAAAVLLRFVRYTDRWGLGPDQANFAVTGLYMVREGKIPLLGPFSSGGPFQIGPHWYWMVAAGWLLFPFVPIGPWVFMGVLSLVFIVLVMAAAFLLGGPVLSVVTGMLAAVSPAQITQSTNLSNQTPIPVFAVLSVLFALLYRQTKRPYFLFLLGIMVGTAAAIHSQGIALVPLAAAVYVFSGPTVTGILLLALGGFLPWVPVLYADSGHGWYNTVNMFEYYRVGQYAVSLDVLGRNWRTFLTASLPGIWGFTAGGYAVIGAILMAVTPFLLAERFLKKHLNRDWLTIVTAFAVMIWIVRYARVPLFDSFVVFLHPFILLLTGFAIVRLLNYSRPLGITVLTAVIVMSLVRDTVEIRSSTNFSDRESMRITGFLETWFPGKSFDVWGGYGSAKSVQAYYYLYATNRADDRGIRIGIRESGSSAYPVLYKDDYGSMIIDLSAASGSGLRDEHWERITAARIYSSNQDWYETRGK